MIPNCGFPTITRNTYHSIHWSLIVVTYLWSLIWFVRNYYILGHLGLVVDRLWPQKIQDGGFRPLPGISIAQYPSLLVFTLIIQILKNDFRIWQHRPNFGHLVTAFVFLFPLIRPHVGTCILWCIAVIVIIDIIILNINIIIVTLGLEFHQSATWLNCDGNLYDYC